jgi:RHS repeat-associated protein
MKNVLLFVAISILVVNASRAQTQTPCSDGQLLWRYMYPLCEPDGLWHIVEDDYYLCPTNVQQSFKVTDLTTDQACDQAPPPIAGHVFQILSQDTNCQSALPLGTITITECVNGFWQTSTYQLYHCLNGSIDISVPAIAVTVTTIPCTNAAPASDLTQTPCNGGQLLSRNAYSICNSDGFWHVVEDDTYLCPALNLMQTFRVSDVATTQPCGQAPPPVVGTVFQPLNGATNCQSPALTGTVTMSECVDGFWQQSTYGVYRCANGTRWIDVPAWKITRTTTPCTNVPPTPLYASAPVVVPLAPTNGEFKLGAFGPPGLDLLVETSPDFADWTTLDLVSPFNGVTTLVDSNSPSFTSRFYRGILTPRQSTIHYAGNNLVMVDHVPPGFGPGAVVTVSGQNNSGTFTDRVTADSNGLYTLALDTSGEPNSSFLAMYFTSADGSLKSTFFTVPTVRDSLSNPAAEVPKNLVIDDSTQPVEPDICTCETCACPVESSLMFFANSFTPNDPGTELATGKLRLHFPILSFQTRMLGFSFQFNEASLVSYSGPIGNGFSHSFNMMIVQNGQGSGQIITPDLRVYKISSADGVNWSLPEGFESTLTLNTNMHRWTLTHYSGFQAQFFQATTNAPGYPVAISDPNGNATTLAYNNSGLLQSLTTDLGQTETLSYDTNGVLASFTDHIGRTWTFTYDNSNRLTQIITPATQFAAIPAGGEVIDTTLAGTLVTRGRTTTIAYTNLQSPLLTNSSAVASITDDRGAVPQAWVYDAQGRVVTNFINGNPEVHIYRPSANPAPLPLLDPMNQITRTIDREGNITDYEIHSRAGGPVGGAGQFGIRRKVTWTETGKGNPALRPNEPNYYEERWLQDCDCLSPAVVVQPFSSQDAANLTFDTNGIPLNWPRTVYTYNGNRQVTTNLYTDGANFIQTTSTYQSSGFGQAGQFSLLLTQTDPRVYDTNPIYAGLNFVHSYQYDTTGNKISHSAPIVTRGVSAPQAIVEFWTYNSFGQKLSHTDANGDITTYTYNAGTSSGGDINTVGTFGGYLATMTCGAVGSADPVTSLTTAYKVNALGMVTRGIDPRGLVTDYQYDTLGERILLTEPSVTLWTGQQVRYTTRTVYDGVGNAILVGRTNIDYNGVVLPVPSVDLSRSYDAANNLLSVRIVVDSNHSDDLITHYAYNSNDLPSVVQKPMGNRQFVVYDERLLPFRTFYGVAPGPQITSDFPTPKQATTLGATSFVGYRQDNYDSRKNLIQMQDGRGYVTHVFYDFNNRSIARSDPNGNGITAMYDSAGNALTTQAGTVSQTTGAITKVLRRAYYRYDEDNREYQTVNEINLAIDQSQSSNPSADGSPSYLTLFDPDSRVLANTDANGNQITFTYDAAGRRLSVTDALGNSSGYSYDQDGNMVALTEREVPGPGATGAAETYVTTFAYDEDNRRTNTAILGLNGDSVNDRTSFAFDSRHNRRLMEDADGNFTITTLDYQNRTTLIQRFDADPTSSTPNILSRNEVFYDLNSRKSEDHSFSVATNSASIQITRYAYDNADRLVQTTYPDFNSVGTTYDANSNPIILQEQRGVVFSNTYDPANRLTLKSIALTNGVPGVSREQFTYDARNLLTSAENNYASVTRTFDALGRVTNETQAIRLDASGFVNGWEQPVSLQYGYDRQSNQTNCLVVAGSNANLSISRTVDALNRNQNISAQYFNVSNSSVATYRYFGPGRVQAKILANGAIATNSYDTKRRLSSLVWNGSSNNLLVGFQYSYDSMDNPQYERWLHDKGYYDNYQYNHRYELTGVAYRSSNSVAPASFPTSFVYDDNLSRSQATYGGPFRQQPTNTDSYTINTSDEYIGLTRNSVVLTPAYDPAGNMTSVPVLPVTGFSAQADLNATAAWDAFNCLFSINTGVTSLQNYRYDPFRRRIASLSGLGLTPDRRFIYAGWVTVEERLFDSGATPASAPSTLERIYVDGPQIGEHLLTAIDRNGDGVLGSANLNNMDINADQWYYFLPNRLGSIAALLAANNPDQTLEYNRYTAYGEATVLPTVTGNSSDLSVNFAQGWQRSSPEHGNFYFFTGQRFDDQTGLYYYRNRYYDPRAGRFASRDLAPQDAANLYQYCLDSPEEFTDPSGWQISCQDECKMQYDIDITKIQHTYYIEVGACTAAGILGLFVPGPGWVVVAGSTACIAAALARDAVAREEAEGKYKLCLAKCPPPTAATPGQLPSQPPTAGQPPAQLVFPSDPLACCCQKFTKNCKGKWRGAREHIPVGAPAGANCDAQCAKSVKSSQDTQWLGFPGYCTDDNSQIQQGENRLNK